MAIIWSRDARGTDDGERELGGGGEGGKQDVEVEVAAVVTRVGAPYRRQQFPPNIWRGKKLLALP